MKRLFNAKRLLALIAVLLLAPDVYAQCTTTGTASADIDINNVRARIWNNGALFWNGDPAVYNIPKALPGQPIVPNSIFASGIWMGGQVNGQPRQIAADYGGYELYAGPLNGNGQPLDPSCSEFDRVWVVSKAQVRAYVDNPTNPIPFNLDNWPVGVGAPAYNDANGNGSFDEGESEVVASDPRQVINLAGGERPLFPGNGSADQMAFTIMNDVAGPHPSTGSAPIGLEIRLLAFSFNLGGALGNTTFYRYELEYQGTDPLVNTFLGVWSDPDLGNAGDDYVGSDTTLGLGYVYNGDNFDDTSNGYGAAPPALGYDFFQGPLVDSPGETFIDPDGTTHVNKTRLGTTKFIYYNNGGGVTGDPATQSADWYNYLQGIWRDGTPMVNCGNGHLPTAQAAGLSCVDNAVQADFIWPGDPTTDEFWSERNIDGDGTANAADDRRFLISTGPFVLNPGETQEIVYGIVWARGADNLDSVNQMKAADAVVQSAYDANFELAQPPEAPIVSKTESDQQVILSWRYDSPTYISEYNEFNPFSFEEIDGQPADRTYNFEAFQIYEYPTIEFAQSEARLVGQFDLINGVDQVLEPRSDGRVVEVASFQDSGLQYSLRLTNLTNYREYFYGVRAVGYNGDTEILKVLESPIVAITAIPAPEEIGGEDVQTDTFNRNIVGERIAGGGGGQIQARIINPGQVIDNAQYEARFYNYEFEFEGDTLSVLTFDVVRVVGTDETTVVDGRAQARRTGQALPQTAQNLVLDGLEFSITGPDPEVLDYQVVANAAGPVVPTAGAAADYRNFPGLGRTNVAGQQSTDEGGQGVTDGHETFFFIGTTDNYAAGDALVYSDFETAVTVFSGGFGAPSNGTWEFLVPNDFEIRFTGNGKAWNYFSAAEEILDVPFELWNTGVGTPDDTSDDFQLVPYVLDDDGNGEFNMRLTDSGLSGADNDPFTDRFYWVTPRDETPGSQGYNNFITAVQEKLDAGTVPGDECVGWADPYGGGVQVPSASLDPRCDGASLLARMTLVNWNGSFGDSTEAGLFYQPVLPETGTVFRIVTSKPNIAGDVLAFNTTGLGVTVSSDSTLANSREQIGIVPNPYKGVSTYETSNLIDKARFVGLPNEATIRIFTVSGTLVRTLEKNSPARTLDWDLQTEQGLPVASGMYLIHIEMADGEEKILKFGVIKKRVQFDLL